VVLLKDKEFVCIDVEATGLNPREDRVVEVAAMRFTLSDVLDEFESLVDPECEIPICVQKVHHISQEMVQGQPKIRDLLPDLLEFVGSHTIVGHGISFDVEILAEEARRANIPYSLRDNCQLDTLRLARLYGESPSNSLDVLRHHFNITAEGAHRAKNDVIVNIKVFRYLVKQFRTFEQVSKVLSKPILMKTMPLGKHKGRRLKEIPLSYLQWAVRQSFDQDLIFSLQSELRRRRKERDLSIAHNPFAHLL